MNKTKTLMRQSNTIACSLSRRINSSRNGSYKGYQKMEFEEEFMALHGKKNKKLNENESIGRLNPYVGEDGLLRVAGRLQQSNLDEKTMHPVMLPNKEKLTEMIIKWCHQKTAHSRRNVTLNKIRTSGHWVIQGNSAMKKKILRCVTCRLARKLASKSSQTYHKTD